MLDGADQAAGQHHDFLADADDAAGDLAAEAAEVVQLGVGGAVGAVDPLDGEAEAVEVPVAADVDAFEVAQERGAGIPGGVLGGFDDVVAVERAERDELDVLHVEAWQELLELVADFDEALLAPVHQVHLVDGDDEVGDAEQRARCRCGGGFAR